MAASADAEWKPASSPWLIAIAVMLATFMEVMDTSIAAVALPNIAGSISATSDEATWVLTSYLVANAIFIPASTWLSLKFGAQTLLNYLGAHFHGGLVRMRFSEQSDVHPGRPRDTGRRRWRPAT